MNGPLAQMVALTCHAEARIGGQAATAFFPNNSTCRFCATVDFVEWKTTLFGSTRERIVADTPDAWLAAVAQHALAVRLVHAPVNDARISDRMSAAFAGRGGRWAIEVLRGGDESEFWAARWQVTDRNAPEQRIWSVRYGLVARQRTSSDGRRSLQAATRDLRAALQAIHAFSTREDCATFTPCFARALAALDDPDVPAEHYLDLAPAGHLSEERRSVLAAATSAWVFGGMGSWNDLGFSGDAQQEYERVSEELFRALNESIALAASGTAAAFAP